MFTGIVEELGKVVDVQTRAPGRRFVIAAQGVSGQVRLGESIAVNGCCLTVVDHQGERLAFDAGPETLQRTNLGELKPADAVNVERSLQVGDRLSGHFVTGHIDAVGWLDRREDDRDWSTFWFRCPARLTREMASKGSIAVDGVSLTLVNVTDDRFSVALIPHTLQVTTLGHKALGDRVNLETDLLAKYVRRQLEGSPGVEI
jgi:riboflavin synthase